MIFFFNSLFVRSLDESIGRVEKSSFSQQTLMELLVSKFEGRTVFLTRDGAFADISQWLNVTVNDFQEVTHIDWDGRQLFHREGGTIDMHWLPDTVQTFKIAHRNVHGTIDTFDLPRGLLEFSTRSNPLSGTFDVSGLPRGMASLVIGISNLSGSFDLTALPPTLTFCAAYQSDFSGTLDFSQLPEPLEYLNLSGNHFSGEIDLSELPLALASLIIHTNEFLQDELRIGNKLRCRCTMDRNTIERIVNTDGVEVQPQRGDHGLLELLC
uniref:Leucine-rich repeat protein n=1 Tax=Paramoeba aestuarina TaxID=180227 RepID=A0A7S4KKR7_9EUKA|mmetsp:Transcript_20864/g.32544  ORF Transcript_20864/g.32544 Transcript_20864/m.32544 type:complete len:268 (+) Transcript_20864:27-830(+)